MFVKNVEDISGGRYKVTMDDDVSFVLYKGEISKFRIAVDTDIDDTGYEQIMHEILPRRARLRLLNLLARRPYTEHQLKVKLIDGGYPESIADDAISYVSGMHLIDDYGYCRDYIFHSSTTKSRKRIVSDLLKKGVPACVIESAMSSIEDDGDLAEEDSLIYRLMEKRSYNKDTATYEEKQKMLRFLYGRGFACEAIDRCMKS